MKLREFTWLIVSLIFIFTACSSALRTQNSNKQQEEKLDLNRTSSALNQIAYLTFEVTLVDSLKDLYSFKLKNTFFAPGILKNSAFETEIGIEPYYFYYQVLNENKKAGNYQKVKNPLQTVYEYSPEKSLLNKRLIEKKSGELIVRFNYNKDSKYIYFFKFSQYSKSLKPIFNALL